MLSLEKGRVIEIIYQDEKIQILNIKSMDKARIEKAINYIEQTGICTNDDIVAVNTVGNRLGLGTGGYNFVYLNLSGGFTYDDVLDRNQGHIIKMKYTPSQIRVKSVEENDEFKSFFNNNAKSGSIPVIYAILHSMLPPLVKTIKHLNPSTIISCIYTYGGAMNANNSFTLRKLREDKLIDSVITIGECYGGDYEAISLASGILFGQMSLNSDIIIVCCGPGVAGSSTYYGFSTFDFIGYVYTARLLGFMPVIIPRISMADMRERHRGISMQSISILETLDFSVHVPIYKASSNTQEFEYINTQLMQYGIMERHIVKYIDDEIIKECIEYISGDTKVMGRSFLEDPWYFYNCSAAGICSIELSKKMKNY